MRVATGLLLAGLIVPVAAVAAVNPFKPPGGFDPTSAVGSTTIGAMQVNLGNAMTQLIALQSLASGAIQASTFGQPSGTAQLDAVGGMSANSMSPLYSATLRTFAAAASESIDVRAMGARCDGFTVDTLAFQKAFDLATGHISNNPNFTAAEQTKLAGYNNIGLNYNHAAKIIVPDGKCIISGTLTANLLPSNNLQIVGDGSNGTHLVELLPGVDLIDIVETPALGGDDIVDFSGPFSGQSIYIKGISLQANAADNSAIKIVGIPVGNANQPPHLVLEDIEATNAQGYNGKALGWQIGLDLTNVYYTYIRHFIGIDESSAQSMWGIKLTSTATAPYATTYGTIVCEDCQQTFGQGLAQIKGDSWQQLLFERPVWLYSMQAGIQWIPATTNTATISNGSGAINIHAAYGNSDHMNLDLEQITTAFVSDSFFYSGNAPANVDYTSLNLTSDGWINLSNNSIAVPQSGTIGTGKSTGIKFSHTLGSSQAYLPSILANTTVAGGDVGVAAQGINTTVDGVQCANTIACVADTYTGSDATQHPHILNIVTGSTATGGGLSQTVTDGTVDEVVRAARQETFGASVTLGLPGVTLPGSVSGAPGTLAFRSIPSTDGTEATTDVFDAQLTASGGVRGTNGAGTLSLAAAGGLLSSGPLVDQSVKDVPEIASGFQLIGTGAGNVIDCAGTLAAGTVTLPLASIDRLPYRLRATCTINALTLKANTGQTSQAYGSATTLSPTAPIKVLYDQAISAWIAD